MVIISVIVAIICLFGLACRIIFAIKIKQRLKNLTGSNLKEAENFKAAVKMIYGEPVKIWKDALLICSEQESNEPAIAYDFSHWDNKKIIGVIALKPHIQLDEEGNARIGVVPK